MLITYTLYPKNYAKVLEVRRFGVLTFWFAGVSVCRRFGCRRFGLPTFWLSRLGLSMFCFVDVLVCQRFGMSTFRCVDVLVCRCFGLSTLWLSTFRFAGVLVVDVSVWRRFDYLSCSDNENDISRQKHTGMFISKLIPKHPNPYVIKLRSNLTTTLTPGACITTVTKPLNQWQRSFQIKSASPLAKRRLATASDRCSDIEPMVILLLQM